MGSDLITEKRILITGGNGYLGSFLTRELQHRNARVFVVSNDVKTVGNNFNVDITRADDLNKVVRMINPDIVFHLAASLRRERDFSIYPEVAAINVQGTLNLLNALEETDYRQFIFTSTSEVYGNADAVFNENMVPDPVSPYSVSKANAEMLIKAVSALNKRDYTILRVFNFYGKNMPHQFFIPQIINSLSKSIDFPMTKGRQIRDFMHVDDVIRALVLTLGNPKAGNQTFNVCSGKGVELIELAETIAAYVKTQAKIVPGAIPYRENEIWRMIGDRSKISALLGFEPEISLQQGLMSIINSPD